MSADEIKKEPPQSGKGMANGFRKGSGRASYPKTDSRHWRSKVFKPVVVENGKRREVNHYSARMQWQGRRQSFPLLSGNIEAAATRAAKIFKSLQARGWDETLKEFSPSFGKPERGALTVGDYLEEVAKVVSIRPVTLAGYTGALRRIVADIKGIEDEVDHDGKKKSRHNCHHASGRKSWMERVHAVKLAEITPSIIRQWQVEFVRKAAGDAIREKSRTTSANSYVRMAKSLFAPKKVLRHLPKGLVLPSPLPFDDVSLFPEGDGRYSSKINLEKVMEAAAGALATAEPEQWKVLLLALGAGLRRSEIDSLLWRQVDFQNGVIRIETTEQFRPKSDKSAGDVEIDGELVALLRGYKAKATGDFVIEAKDPERNSQAKELERSRLRVAAGKGVVSYVATRSETIYSDLCDWLRKNGVDALRPIHTLRKEFGSLVCKQAGLYAASRALRHGDVTITAKHYLDKKERVTVGIGALLPAGNVVNKPKKSPRKNGKARPA